MTTTPLQALSLLNNSFVLRLSGYCSERVVNETGYDRDRQIDRVWKLLLGRSPNPREAEASQKLVEQYGLAALCRGLFNVNEFILID